MGISTLISLYLKTLNNQQLIYKNIAQIDEMIQIKQFLDKYLTLAKKNKELEIAFAQTYTLNEIKVKIYPINRKLPVNNIKYLPLLDNLSQKELFLKYINKYKPFDKYSFNKIIDKYFNETGDMEIYKINFLKYITFNQGKLNLYFADKNILNLFDIKKDEINSLDKEEIKVLLHNMPYDEFNPVVGIKITKNNTVLNYLYNIKTKKITMIKNLYF
jgi:hypothetical protein